MQRAKHQGREKTCFVPLCRSGYRSNPDSVDVRRAVGRFATCRVGHGRHMDYENAYTTLKQLLISRLTPSEPQRLQQLLHHTELGDRTPSPLLRHMRQLLHTDGATTTDADSRLLRELFVQRLPVNVRMILASAADKRLSELAELADSVLAVAPPSVAALQPDIASRAPTTALHDIREQISRLADTVAAMQARSTPEERQRPAAQQKTCWYHRKYSNAARKCIPPCDHAGNGSGRH
ncbi:hypothetical protein HPB50_003986 [Hyalomma asiaticum]|uniref:Uncharacterized protein n=1 Tax=Hyalomma asiaticum TaxID=266040 RepID=A0ACB7TCA3_HYAAI|nr:hypothetical protein HPB50_003986 [Hyalomma asiaticum]